MVARLDLMSKQMRVLRKTKFLPKLGIEPGTPGPKSTMLSTQLSLHMQKTLGDGTHRLKHVSKKSMPNLMPSLLLMELSPYIAARVRRALTSLKSVQLQKSG